MSHTYLPSTLLAAMMVTTTLGMSVMADWCMWCSLTWLIMMRLLNMIEELCELAVQWGHGDVEEDQLELLSNPISGKIYP